MRTLFLAVASAAFFLATTAAQAVDPVVKCQSSKLKAWAKLRACEHKASAKKLTGGTADPTTCQAKFDAALTKAGTACRYLDNGDATVTDLDTGLMWEKTDDDGGLTDKDNVYTWAASFGYPDGFVFTYFLATLNQCEGWDPESVTKGYAGYCDWRLPQIDELQAIVNCSFGDPCIDQSAFGPTNPASFSWSASSVPVSSPSTFAAWAVDLHDGGAVILDKNSDRQVRAVRRAL